MCGERLFGLTPWFVSVMCVVAAGTVHAAEPPDLTEPAAIELALARPAFREAKQGRIATAESAGRSIAAPQSGPRDAGGSRRSPLGRASSK